MMSQWSRRFLKAPIMRDGCPGVAMGIEVNEPAVASYNEVLVCFSGRMAGRHVRKWRADLRSPSL
jgi:hypothetical protein